MQRIAAEPDDLLSHTEIAAMGGLAYMQRMAAGEIAAPAICGGLDFRLHSVETGRVTFRGSPDFRMTNPMGGVHGGWYGTLLDSAMACAVLTAVPPGYVHTTLEYKVSLTRAIPLGMETEATGIIEHAGRTIAVARGEIRGVADGKLYATGSTTCLVMRVPSGAAEKAE